jgi:hypothetical protein
MILAVAHWALILVCWSVWFSCSCLRPECFLNRIRPSVVWELPNSWLFLSFRHLIRPCVFLSTMANRILDFMTNAIALLNWQGCQRFSRFYGSSLHFTVMHFPLSSYVELRRSIQPRSIRSIFLSVILIRIFAKVLLKTGERVELSVFKIWIYFPTLLLLQETFLKIFIVRSIFYYINHTIVPFMSPIWIWQNTVVRFELFSLLHHKTQGLM